MTQKKQERRKKIEDCAKQLFLKSGVSDTSVDEIAMMSGIAKGTFYLYFKDKEEIINHVVTNFCAELLDQAFLATETDAYPNIIERLVHMAEFIIDFFTENPSAIRLVKKNLSISLLKAEIYNLSELDFAGIWAELVTYCKSRGFDKRETYDRLFIIVEMTSAATYYSIAEGKPDSIERMKPIILNNIRRLLG